MPYTLEQLRKKHPRFVYKSFRVRRKQRDLVFDYEFVLEPDIVFKPRLVFHNLDLEYVKRSLSFSRQGTMPQMLRNLAYYIGFAEIFTYWKAACSPEIVVACAAYQSDLTENFSWFLDLLKKGMGEFFYTNDIDFRPSDFVKLTFSGKEPAGLATPHSDYQLDVDKYLVPIGGGKDAIVTLETLKRTGKKVGCFLLNPTKAALDIVKTAAVEDFVLATRTIDPQLLALNKAGYLNGHTPFSSYLAFASTAAAVFFGYGNVAISQERSSNEGNVDYLGQEINHQYSKSLEYETNWREFNQRYFTTSVNYFSFLRPLYEVQIARMFSRLPQYFEFFRSCNRGQKTNTWCHQCPKCLFAFAALYPFVDEKTLIGRGKIFQHSLFENAALADTALSFIRPDAVKPFECLGTREEATVMFYLAVKKLRERGVEKLPPVLARVDAEVLQHEKNLAERAQAVLSAWTDEHFLPESLATLLKNQRIL